MWEVPSDKLKIQLPEGFRLKEDTDFVHLFHGDGLVESFSIAGVNLAEIEKRAKSFLEKIEWNRNRHGL